LNLGALLANAADRFVAFPLDAGAAGSAPSIWKWRALRVDARQSQFRDSGAFCLFSGICWVRSLRNAFFGWLCEATGIRISPMLGSVRFEIFRR
jgi:hypothetical protein